MEVKITPKSCSKLLLWLQSQVKETKLFRDGQTKAGDEGEMDPAYGKSECLLALLTVPITSTQLNESCFLQRCSACSVSFGLQRVPTHSQRTDMQQTSLEALLKESVSQWDLVSPTCSSTLHMVLQGSKCQNITGLWNVTGRLGCFYNFCRKYQSQIQQSCQGFQATLFCLKTTSVQPCTSTPSKSMFSLRYFLQDLQIIMLL